MQDGPTGSPQPKCYVNYRLLAENAAPGKKISTALWANTKLSLPDGFYRFGNADGGRCASFGNG